MKGTGSEEDEMVIEGNNSNNIDEIDDDEIPPLSPNIVEIDEEEERLLQQQQQQQNNEFKIQGDFQFHNRVSSVFDSIPKQHVEASEEDKMSLLRESAGTKTTNWTHYSLEDVGMDDELYDSERENRMALADALRIAAETRKNQEEEEAARDTEERDITYRPQTLNNRKQNKKNVKRKMINFYDEEGDVACEMDVEHSSNTAGSSSRMVIPKHLSMDSGEEETLQFSSKEPVNSSPTKGRKATRNYRTRCEPRDE